MNPATTESALASSRLPWLRIGRSLPTRGVRVLQTTLALITPLSEAVTAMEEPRQHRTPEKGVSVAPDTGPYSARDAAALIGTSERTIRRAIARGELTAA